MFKRTKCTILGIWWQKDVLVFKSPNVPSHHQRLIFYNYVAISSWMVPLLFSPENIVSMFSKKKFSHKLWFVLPQQMKIFSVCNFTPKNLQFFLFSATYLSSLCCSVRHCWNVLLPSNLKWDHILSENSKFKAFEVFSVLFCPMGLWD